MSKPFCKAGHRGEHEVFERSCRISRVRHEPVRYLSLSFPIEHPGSFLSVLWINKSAPSAANDAAKPTGKRWRGAFEATGCAKGDRQGHPVAESGRKRRLIRHTFLRDQTAPTQGALTVSMIESSLGTLLVTLVRQAAPLAIALVAAGGTAIIVPSVTVVTDPEQHAAAAANTRT